jgi:DNA (cytosine-5)-methyltransferase 1
VIPVIDLFAGPGGLGEGFASLLDRERRRVFRIALSIEMDPSARETLRLRSFFRQFEPGQAPEEYYEVLRGKLRPDQLYEKFPVQAKASDSEAWQAELGKNDPAKVNRRIRKALKGASDWVLIGGPPCQAYSLVGRARVINVDREKYEKDGRHTLYEQYLRILRVHRPPVFVMENVKGILSSKHKGNLIVEKILADLQAPFGKRANSRRSAKQLGYNLFPFADYRETLPLSEGERAPSDYVIQAEKHEIPQARHRFIVLGVRNDINWTPPRLQNMEKQITVWNAIRDLPRLRSRLSGKGAAAKKNDTQEVWAAAVREMLLQPLNDKNGIEPALREKIVSSLKKLRDVGPGGEFVRNPRQPKWQHQWFWDGRIKGTCNHECRRHRKDDLWRYLFASSFAAVRKKSPRLRDFPPHLLPDHKNIARLADADGDVPFNDRFRVQVKHCFSATVTSHIAKDGHYFIHYDPTQCRSLTVREAARLQTFPDNYFFRGNKTKQYRQVGNAVPPLLAYKLAGIVANCFFDRVED